MLSAARVSPSQRSEHRHYSIVRKFAAMRARIADERSNELQRRRLLRIVTGTDPVLDGGIAGASNDSEASFEARRIGTF